MDAAVHHRHVLRIEHPKLTGTSKLVCQFEFDQFFFFENLTSLRSLRSEKTNSS